MRVVVSASGKTLEDQMDPRFGRAQYFLLVDTETMEYSAHDNKQNLTAAQGAGVQAAENVVNLGAEAVISGHCGPKAFRVLQAAEVKVYTADAGTVAEALVQFREGKLSESTQANTRGHW